MANLRRSELRQRWKHLCGPQRAAILGEPLACRGDPTGQQRRGAGRPRRLGATGARPGRGDDDKAEEHSENRRRKPGLARSG